MLQTTFYKPDTCDCQLVFQWDSDLANPEYIPVEEFTNSEGETFRTKRCEDHPIQDLTELHQKAWHRDNKTKNETITKIKEVLPEEEPEWSFDTQRNLVVKLKSKDKKVKDDLNKNTPTHVIIE